MLPSLWKYFFFNFPLLGGSFGCQTRPQPSCSKRWRASSHVEGSYHRGSCPCYYPCCHFFGYPLIVCSCSFWPFPCFSRKYCYWKCYCCCYCFDCWYLNCYRCSLRWWVRGLFHSRGWYDRFKSVGIILLGYFSLTSFNLLFTKGILNISCYLLRHRNRFRWRSSPSINLFIPNWIPCLAAVGASASLLWSCSGLFSVFSGCFACALLCCFPLANRK